MTAWADFFEVLDSTEDADTRAAYLELLGRNFEAVGHPGAWPDFAFLASSIQDRLVAEWLVWALRDVEWLPLRADK